MTWLKAQVFATAPVDAPKNIAHFKNGQKWPKNNNFVTFANESKSMIHSVRRWRRTVATSAFALRCKSRFSFVNICKIDTFHFVCNFWKWKYKNRLENDVNNNPKKTKKDQVLKRVFMPVQTKIHDLDQFHHQLDAKNLVEKGASSVA